ncbi:MAG: lipopolysaccharide biosynthesis protein [candidate division KSB1 bacterium]|nr:lipopolysaccharide biosynthesis protein [candidate division KSB1 bacterium]
MSLRSQTISGVLWTGMAKMTMQLMLIAVQLVLARLLSKADFGIVGMAGLVTVAIGMVNDKGLGTSVIQKKTIRDSELSTMFWISLVFGLLLYLVSFAASFPLSIFFRNDTVQPVISVIALGFVIGGFGIVPKSILTREMAFKRLAIIEIISVSLSGIIAVTLAFLGWGVWSLVANVLLRDSFMVIALWFACPWRPRLHYSHSEFKSFFQFSANVLSNDVMIYLVMNADITIVGRILGETALGLYTWALYMVKLPVQRISGIVAKVVFPAFSKVQDGIQTFQRGYLRAMTYISLITFPILIILGVYAQEFILVFVTDKWINVVVPLQILIPMAMLKSVGTIKGSVLMAVGRPDIELKWNCFYLLPLAGCVWLGTRWGIIGVAAAFTALYVVTWPVIQDITNRQINVTPKLFGSAFTATGPASLVLFAGGGFFRYVLVHIWNWQSVFVLIAGGIVSSALYLAMIFWLDASLLTEWKTMIKQRKKI